MKTLVWLRNDLRVADNPALFAALEAGETEACFLVSEAQWRSHDVGERRLAWIHHTLSALSTELAELGIKLHVLDVPWFKDAPAALLKLLQTVAATHLHYNAQYPLNEVMRDAAVGDLVKAHGIEVQRFHGNLTLPPGSISNGEGKPYRTFTPYKKRWLSVVQAIGHVPLPKPKAVGQPLQPEPIEVLSEYASAIDVAALPAGEQAAIERLSTVKAEQMAAYADQRDLPGVAGTSGLSPYLAVGAISANQCLAAAESLGAQASTWVNELIWREFYHHVVAQFPHVSKGKAFKPETEQVPWRHAPSEYAAWQAGETGYPLVDAAMKQLTSTGWMHNRLRMVAAMFLSKHLLIDWRHGERFFMQELIDGDFAANNGGWQWSASTGTDAVPYFRIFNPARQGERFDPQGAFTRKYLPVLANVPNKYLYQPHAAEIVLDYPQPIVEHSFARQRALDAFKA